MAMKNNGFVRIFNRAYQAWVRKRKWIYPAGIKSTSYRTSDFFTKGCYIGQETVARAKYRGANKRAMYVLSGETTVTPKIGSEIEMQLETAWRKTGTIVSAVNFDGVFMVTSGDE